MNKTKIETAEKIECACGCGRIFNRYDQWGRPRRFISGHNLWGNKHAVGIKHTDEWKQMMSNKMTGHNNPQFKTGKVIDDQGYVLVLCPNHPHKKHGNYIYEHRSVMEKHLDRFLEPTEIVHHINGDRADNRIENLRLFNSHSDHYYFEQYGKPKPDLDSVPSLKFIELDRETLTEVNCD